MFFSIIFCVWGACSFSHSPIFYYEEKFSIFIIDYSKAELLDLRNTLSNNVIF